MQIRTDIEIHASAERVWAVLSDFAAYPQWNPFVRSVSGDVKKGQRITVVLGGPGEAPMLFRPRVLPALFSRRVERMVRSGFEAMNQALEERAEGAPET